VDKQPFFERLASVPIYQWQGFVQTPSLNADENLDLEVGETIYENKYGWEWTMFWKLLFLGGPLMAYILSIQWYDNNMVNSWEYWSRFNLVVIPHNMMRNAQENNRIENINYWGAELWYIQIAMRKFIVYPFLILSAYAYLKIWSHIGTQTVLKAAFNRSKDVVFIWRPGNYLRKRLDICELHYLERPMNYLPMSGWQHYAELNGNKKNGYVSINDLRTNNDYHWFSGDQYWNHDVKSYFDDNTSTYWRGNTCKDVNKGLMFENSDYTTIEETELHRKVEEEIKEAIVKFGPIQRNDYEHSFKYQMKKKMNDDRYRLVSGVNH
jgi:hypothetical protein